MTTTDTTEPRETRTVITTAQVRAQDLRDDDFILIDNQWRALFEIHRSSKSVTSMLAADEKNLAEIAEEIASVRMDTRQNGAPGVQGQIQRPGLEPAVFEQDDVTVASHPGNAHSDSRTVRTTSAIAALLDAGEYIAARWVRDEASDGSIVEDAWAVFRQWTSSPFRSSRRWKSDPDPEALASLEASEERLERLLCLRSGRMVAEAHPM